MIDQKVLLSMICVLSASVAPAAAQDFGQGPRRSLLETQSSDVPQGSVRIGGGERVIPAGGRSPWHTSGGPKLLYVIEGTMAVEGLAGKVYMTCGPAPGLCFNPHRAFWFFRNIGQGPLKFVVIGIDAVETPTMHEIVGQITRLSGNQVTLAVGDFRTSDLSVPRREVNITVAMPGAVAVGDDVITLRHNEKDHKADSLVKLSRRWQ
ncbi:MAG: hypothetical protein HY322_21235 [Betaproteobacteria bacterium]|nr:hypothetical protein [Betaproteobacteria bacterium]